jgi:hypothetical protein
LTKALWQESARGTDNFSPGIRSMANSKFFSGPPSNKATASTIAAAATTLFWTIAAHTFWKSMSTADMTLYITTSTVVLTAIIGFVIPESAAYTQHNNQRLAAQTAAPLGSTTTPAVESAIGMLQARIQGMEEVQSMMAARLGVTSKPAISTQT